MDSQAENNTKANKNEPNIGKAIFGAFFGVLFWIPIMFGLGCLNFVLGLRGVTERKTPLRKFPPWVKRFQIIWPMITILAGTSSNYVDQGRGILKRLSRKCFNHLAGHDRNLSNFPECLSFFNIQTINP